MKIKLFLILVGCSLFGGSGFAMTFPPLLGEFPDATFTADQLEQHLEFYKQHYESSSDGKKVVRKIKNLLEEREKEIEYFHFILSDQAIYLVEDNGGLVCKTVYGERDERFDKIPEGLDCR
jgi:hypothetical protein